MYQQNQISVPASVVLDFLKERGAPEQQLGYLLESVSQWFTASRMNPEFWVIHGGWGERHQAIIAEDDIPFDDMVKAHELAQQSSLVAKFAKAIQCHIGNGDARDINLSINDNTVEFSYHDEDGEQVDPVSDDDMKGIISAIADITPKYTYKVVPGQQPLVPADYPIGTVVFQCTTLSEAMMITTALSSGHVEESVIGWMPIYIMANTNNSGMHGWNPQPSWGGATGYAPNNPGLGACAYSATVIKIPQS